MAQTDDSEEWRRDGAHNAWGDTSDSSDAENCAPAAPRAVAPSTFRPNAVAIGGGIVAERAPPQSMLPAEGTAGYAAHSWDLSASDSGEDALSSRPGASNPAITSFAPHACTTPIRRCTTRGRSRSRSSRRTSPESARSRMCGSPLPPPYPKQVPHPADVMDSPPSLPGCEWWQEILWKSMLHSRLRLPEMPMRKMTVQSLCSGLGTEMVAFQASHWAGWK